QFSLLRAVFVNRARRRRSFVSASDILQIHFQTFGLNNFFQAEIEMSPSSHIFWFFLAPNHMFQIWISLHGCQNLRSWSRINLLHANQSGAFVFLFLTLFQEIVINFS